MCSGIGCLSCFRSLSKHVAINSIHIHTSESVMKQPRQRTISYTKMNYRCFEICLSLEHLKMLTEMCWKLDVTLQSCDLRTTSKSMKMRFVSSWLPVRRICFTAITYRIRNIFNIFGCNFSINKNKFSVYMFWEATTIPVRMVCVSFLQHCRRCHSLNPLKALSRQCVLEFVFHWPTNSQFI